MARNEHYELMRRIERFVRLVAEKDHAWSVEAKAIVPEIDRLGPLEEILGAEAVSAEEGAELHDELVMAFAGLAEEPLKPCSPPCVGHLGEKASEMFSRGLSWYRGDGAGAAEPAVDAKGGGG